MLLPTFLLIFCFLAIPIILWWLWRIAPFAGRVVIVLSIVLVLGLAVSGPRPREFARDFLIVVSLTLMGGSPFEWCHDSNDAGWTGLCLR